MARRYEDLTDESFVSIPRDAHIPAGFQKWLDSSKFPETGRIDYLDGEIDIDMSPEDLFTHGTVKTAVVRTLADLITETDRGAVFSDSTRLNARFARLSVEPDALVVLRSSLESGIVQLVPAARKEPDRYAAVEGADLVVEIVSDNSVRKDNQQLPPLYARAGIPELWIIDARGETVLFTIHTLQGDRYEPVEPDAEGWTRSPRLGYAFRLIRRHQPPFPWGYKLEHRDAQADFSPPRAKHIGRR